MQKFFELIPSGTKIPFLKQRWWFIGMSLVLIALSFGAMGYNYATRGSALNLGIDFAGGSQVRLAFRDDVDVDVAAIRSALEELGYEGSSAVSVPDAENEVLIRVKDVVSIDEQSIGKCEAAVKTLGDAKLLGFNHPEGGSKIFLKFSAQPDYPELERRLTSAGCAGKADKGFGKPEEFPVDYALIGIGGQLKNQLDDRFGAGTVTEIVLSETVGARVGNQLKVDGIVSLLYSLGFIFLYVMVRFDLRFAPGGILALAHDAFLVVGAFALTWKEFNLQIVAAVLTVVGYSINDTIVVFDRIRERVALFRGEDIKETAETALNETLSRTILTSGTTLVVVLSTFIFGSGPIKDFAFALIIGLVVGTYSSLYIATPVFLWINRRFYKGVGHLQWAQGVRAEGDPLVAASGDQVDDATGLPIGALRERAADEGDESDARDAADADEPDDGGPKRLSRRRRRPPPAT